MAMASATTSLLLPLTHTTTTKPLSFSATSSFVAAATNGISKLSLSSTKLQPINPISTHQSRLSTVTVFATKGYKMKTHKASAKRFRVTGRGKIVRRKANKQHLLGKKSKTRKNRLSKMVQVNRSDYNNVIGALPYLKVKRSV